MMIKWLKFLRTVSSGRILVISLLFMLFSDEATGRRNREFKYSTPAPKFLQTESNYTYHKGERAILYCSVKHLGTKTISWRRANESLFLTSGTVIITGDTRFEVAHTEDSTDWNLMISNVSTADSGAYECQISSTNRDLRKEVYLNVKGISLTGTLHVDRGRTLKLTCNASGAITPPDYIDWFKDGTKIKPGGTVELRKRFFINSRAITSVLTKSDVIMSDTGTYSCRTSDLQVTSVSVQVLNTNKKQDKREPQGDRYILDSSHSHSHHTSYSLFMTFVSIVCVNLFRRLYFYSGR
ncbi:lachesin-like isoform X2 [Mercenaria mercenaria]|uniref:lachesin-like isoform X2 n=1 Tax=Mercenaria mercenaria TaxID=6596 RepID=UPI00234F67DD|nr:lachesin-like isoform X2 [Mercenaria mercenaria]